MEEETRIWCPHCKKDDFKTSGGLSQHLARVEFCHQRHVASMRVQFQGSPQESERNPRDEAHQAPLEAPQPPRKARATFGTMNEAVAPVFRRIAMDLGEHFDLDDDDDVLSLEDDQSTKDDDDRISEEEDAMSEEDDDGGGNCMFFGQDSDSAIDSEESDPSDSAPNTWIRDQFREYVE